ncbi:hypothetical protein N9N82_07810 [Luminiphilus sp.]|nr:hypothetical protein [Luminiphilus sp.]
MELLSNFGRFFTRFLDPILTGIRQADIGAGLAFLVLLGGVSVFCYALVVYLRDRRLIKRAARVLLGVDSESTFAEKYNVIAQDMASIPRFGEAWSEFCETLIPPKRKSDNSLVPAANTVRPHVYFNTTDLSVGPRFANVWPNIFVGIGLTITFLGLISALTEASTSMGEVAGDSLKVQNVVQNLLNVASAKFYASLVALFVSVILTLLLRFITTNISKHLHGFNRRIETGVRFLSQESLSARANELIEEQLEQLKTFNTDLAIKVGEKVTEAIAPVLNDIREGNEASRKELADGFSGLGDRVSESMSAGTLDAMSRVAESLEAVSSKLDSLGDVLTNSLSGFDEQLKQSMSGLSEALKQTMSGVSQGLNEALGDMAPQIKDSMSSITEVMDGLQNKISDYAANGATQVGDSIKQATAEAGGVISQAGSDFSNAFNAATSGLLSNLESLADNLSTLDKNLIDLPEKLGTVGASLSAAASSITTASTQFSSSASGMKSVIEPLAQFASENRQALQVLSDGLQTSSSAVEIASTKIQESVSTLNQSVEERLRQLDGGDEALERYMVGLNSSAEQLLSRIVEFVGTIDQGFANSIGQLKGAIEDMEAVAEQLAKASESGE